MNTVTDIRENRGIVSISLDGSVCFRIRSKHYAKRPLEVGNEIDPEEYENALAGIQFADAYEAALTSLDFSARTSKEIERSLRSKGYVAAAVAAVVARLEENHLLNDKDLAQRIASSSARKPMGVYAVKQKLRAKGISDADAQDALSLLDDEQQRTAALQAAEKLSRKYQDLPSREARAKLSQALARRGFSWDIVQETVDKMIEDDYE